MAQPLWLSDAQWAAIKPLRPHRDGRPRIDDRRVLSDSLRDFREPSRRRHQAGP